MGRPSLPTHHVHILLPRRGLPRKRHCLPTTRSRPRSWSALARPRRLSWSVPNLPPARGGSPRSPWSPGMWRRNSLVDGLGSCGWQPTLSARDRRTKARFVAEMQRAQARWSSSAMERRCVEGSTSAAARGGTQRSASEGRNGRKSDVFERNGRERG